MPHANFAYALPANDAVPERGGVPLAVSVFANRPQIRAQMREDAEAAGFRIADAGEITGLLEGEARALGDLVLLDCPEISGAGLAALTRLDVRAAQAGAQLIVSTSVDALDEIFACLDQSNPQLLVEPTRAERVIALGRALAHFAGASVREGGEEDRMLLLRLTEQVARIAERLDHLAPPPFGGAAPAADGTFRLESPKSTFTGKDGDRSERSRDPSTTPALPDAKLVRQIIRQRQLRTRFFDADLFADPAWDILLDLTAARAENVRVSVTSLCIASAVPPTTALRWISQMVEAGLLQRIEDQADRRRAFIALTDQAADAMARYFAELGGAAARVI